jgi:hypothetical protein
VNHYVLLPDDRNVETFTTAAQADLYVAAVGGTRMYTLGQLKKLLSGDQWSGLTRRLAEYDRDIAAGRWWRAHAGSDRYALFVFATAHEIKRYSREYLNLLPRKEPTK